MISRRIAARRSLRTSGVFVLGLAVVAASLGTVAVPATSAVAAPATVPAATGACVGGWREIPVPDSAFLSTPFDVLTRKGREAWILGGTNQGVLALRWNGNTWKRTARTTTGHRGIVGGTVIGANKVLGVGYFRPFGGEGEGSLEPMSGRVIVNGWKNRPVADPPGQRATLTDVAGLPSGKAIAVGTRLADGKLRAYAARWTGKKWARKEPSPGTGSGLLGVDRSTAGTTWAVGWKESGLGKPRPYIVKRTSRGWKPVKSAPLPAGSAVLTDIDFRTGNDGWAVGYRAERGSDRSRAVLMHWNGKRWSNVDLPWASEFSALPRSISVGPGGQVWIAGTQPANDQREPRGFIAHGRGQAWQVDTLGVPADLRSEVMAIATTSDGAVAAASVGASLLVLRTCEPDAVSVAKARRGGGRGKVKVGNIGRRRASVRIDAHEPEEHHDPTVDIGAGSAGGDRASIAADGVRTVSLAAPVNHGAFVVRNMAAASGLAQQTKTYDGFAADFDGNGWEDVFYSRHGVILPRLAMNGPDGFGDAPTSAYSSVDRHGCDDADIDNDGDKDILCAVGGSRGKAMKRHELSLQPATGEGEVAIDGLGLSDPLGRGRFVAFLRLNDDPYPEVFVANAPDRDDGWPGYNRFYRNVKGTLVPAPGVGLDSSHGAECVVGGDADQDGDGDLVYCTQYGFAGRPPGLRFMRNEQGKLKDRTYRLGIRPIGDIDVAFADVTGDGRKDLIQLAPKRLRVSKRAGAGYRRIFETKISDAWALAAGDASGDGRADIYVVRGNDKHNKPDRLLVSKNAGTRFISVKIPSTARGSADDVIALDYDQNGLTDFVVLNGRTRAGPVQLLASFPRR
jgi:hypothetical protein